MIETHHWTWPRVARLLAFAFIAIFALLWVAYIINATRGTAGWDTQAYWQAALRLRDGADLYAGTVDPELNTAYRYAPWFAFAWVPLTYLPYSSLAPAWVVILFAAWGAMLWPLRRNPPAMVFLAALTFHAPWVGNVQTLMLLPLVYRLHLADGPVWIGVAASVKALPIVLVLFFIGRREWRRAGLAIGVALVLTAPMLAFDLQHYPFGSAAEVSLAGVSPLVWAVGACVSMLVALRGSNKRWGPLAAGAAVIAAHPRLLLYDASYLLVGLGRLRDRRPSEHAH